MLTDSVARGKHAWEKHSCINCHTLSGEGAYFAPEVSNVWYRWGGKLVIASSLHGHGDYCFDFFFASGAFLNPGAMPIQ